MRKQAIIVAVAFGVLFLTVLLGVSKTADEPAFPTEYQEGESLCLAYSAYCRVNH